MGVVSVVLVVLVIVEDVGLRVLDNHALHDLQAALHAGRVNGLFLLDLDDLGGLLVLGFALGSLLGLLPQRILILLHEGIKDHPLRRLLREDGCLGRVSLDTTLAVDHKRGLRGPLLVIEHISQ